MTQQAGVEHARAAGGAARSVDAAQRHVRQRAHRQRHLLVAQPRHQRRVLQAADAVVDPLDAEQVERLADVGRRPLLARVRDPVQPLVGAPRRRRAANSSGGWPTSARVEPDADEQVAARAAAAAAAPRASSASRSRRKQGISRDGDAVPLARAVASAAAQPVDDHLQRHAARPVCACGSKKISACRTPCAAARAQVGRRRGRRSPRPCAAPPSARSRGRGRTAGR